MIIDSSWRRSGGCRELNFTVPAAQDMLLPMTQPFARERWFPTSVPNAWEHLSGLLRPSMRAGQTNGGEQKVISAVSAALGRKEKSLRRTVIQRNYFRFRRTVRH